MTILHWTWRTMSSAVGAFAVLLASGCVSLDGKAGQANIEQFVSEARGRDFTLDVESDPASIGQSVAEILAAPLAAEDAADVALLNNPHVAIAFARIGITRTELLAASRPANPVLAGSRLTGGGAGAKTTLRLTTRLSDWLLLAARKRFAQGEYQRTQALIANDIMELAAETEAAWYRYAAALAIAERDADISKSADAAAELAARMHTAGNVSELDLLREQTAALNASIEATRATDRALEARFELQKLMGLQGAGSWTTAPLPDVVQTPEPALDALLTLAGARRADLNAAKREANLYDDVVKVADRWRWLGAVDVGIERENETDGSHLTGPTLALGLPIFQQGQLISSRTGLQHGSAHAELRALETSVDSAVRLGHARVAAMRGIVDLHVKSLLPHNDLIVEREQERHRYMLSGQFELLAARRSQIEGQRSYIEALRDYWLARTELARATGGELP